MKHCQKRVLERRSQTTANFFATLVTLAPYKHTSQPKMKKSNDKTREPKKKKKKDQSIMSKTLSIHFVQMNWFYGF